MIHDRYGDRACETTKARAECAGARHIAVRPRPGYSGAMILMRHGQSEFNLHFNQTRCDPGIEDPKLTPLGHEQAERAAAAFADADIRRILVSPYTRALQTAAPIARKLGIPPLVTPIVRERFAFACDIGSPRSALTTAWPEHDFSSIDETWWPSCVEEMDLIRDRAARFRREITGQSDCGQTLVVSHWGFILSLTGRSVSNGEWLRFDPSHAPPSTVVWGR